jgi:hypothetical protein
VPPPHAAEHAGEIRRIRRHALQAEPVLDVLEVVLRQRDRPSGVARAQGRDDGGMLLDRADRLTGRS